MLEITSKYSKRIFLNKSSNYILISCTLFLFALSSASGQTSYDIPQIEGIKVTRGKSVLIPGAESAMAFKFEDGRIIVGKNADAMWSYDNGHTWESGLPGKFDKAAIDLGNGVL